MFEALIIASAADTPNTTALSLLMLTNQGPFKLSEHATKEQHGCGINTALLEIVLHQR